MSDVNKPLLPPSVVDLLILDTFKRNGANLTNSEKPLNDQEKVMIRNLVDDIARQVESFMEAQKKSEEHIRKATLDPANVEYVKELQRKAHSGQRTSADNISHSRERSDSPRERSRDQEEHRHSRDSRSSRESRESRDRDSHRHSRPREDMRHQLSRQEDSPSQGGNSHKSRQEQKREELKRLRRNPDW